MEGQNNPGNHLRSVQLEKIVYVYIELSLNSLKYLLNMWSENLRVRLWDPIYEIRFSLSNDSDIHKVSCGSCGMFHQHQLLEAPAGLKVRRAMAMALSNPKVQGVAGSWTKTKHILWKMLYGSHIESLWLVSVFRCFENIQWNLHFLRSSSVRDDRCK